MRVARKAFTVATSTVADGNMAFRFGDTTEVIQNRTNFLKAHHLGYEHCVVMRSEHKNIVRIVDGTTPAGPLDQSESVEADTLITQTAGLALLLTTADCLPVTLHDPTTGTVALMHVSRHTLVRGLIETTLETLRKELACAPDHLIVNIGPHIHTESYCFPLPLQETSPVLAPYTHVTQTSACIDLLAATTALLQRLGVSGHNISASNIDTYSDRHYFSHVRAVRDHSPEGRIATIASLL